MKLTRFKSTAFALAVIMALSGCNAQNTNQVTMPETTTVTDTTVETIVTTTPVTTTTVTTTNTTTTTAVTTTETTTAEKPVVTTPAVTTTTTTVTSPVAEQNAKPIPVIKDDITYRTIVKYNYGTKNFKLGSVKSYILYDFSTVKEVGAGRDGTTHPTRMCYGLTTETKNGKVYFKPYNDYPSEIKATVNKINFLSDTSSKSLKISDKTMSIDCSDLDNGLYAIQAVFSTGKKMSTGIYVNDGEVWLCSVETMTDSEYSKFKSRREKIYDMMDLYNVKTTNTIDTSNLCFPWNDKAGMNSDTQDWIDFSYKIVNKDWSDSRKIFAFHEWMCENLAYDYYKVNVIKVARAKYYKTYDGSLDMYETNVGVCHDFTNVFLTMCREHDIPCITLDNPTHTWNLVYVNGVWVEIDMTVDIKSGVYGKDLTKWDRPDDIYCYDSYFDEFANSEKLMYINDALWDYDVVTWNKKVTGTGGHDVDSVRLPD